MLNIVDNNKHKDMQSNIGIWAQSILGGTTFLPEKYVWKINKMPEFYIILVWKISKISNFFKIFFGKIIKMPEFYIILVRKIRKISNFFKIFFRKINKIPEFYIIIARKILSQILGGTCPPPAPVSYAYGVKNNQINSIKNKAVFQILSLV